MKKVLFLSVAVLILGITGQANADVTGKVTLSGTPSRGDVKINTAADPSCIHEGTFKTKHWVVGANGELANVVISIVDAPGGAASSDKPLVNQKGCEYAPYMPAIQKGQTITIKNSDQTLHNVHAKAEAGKGKSLFNFGQPVQGMTTDKTFKQVGVVKLKCDVHPWMSSYVYVAENPHFAISGTDGTFAIKSVPDGEYTVQAWHSRFKEPLTQTIKVSGGKADVSFTFNAA